MLQGHLATDVATVFKTMFLISQSSHSNKEIDPGQVNKYRMSSGYEFCGGKDERIRRYCDEKSVMLDGWSEKISLQMAFEQRPE